MTALPTKPVRPSDFADQYTWRQYADQVTAYLAALESAVKAEAKSAARENGWCDSGVRAALGRLGIKAGPRNPLYSVTITRQRVRATSGADAVRQVQSALSAVSFVDRSDKRRDFRHNTTVTASLLEG
jgi:hypothetical protein